MVPVTVTPCAVERYVAYFGGTEEDARTALSAPIFQIAADFGARVVRLPRARVVMRFAEGVAVVLSVMPTDRIPHQLMPLSWGGPPLARLDPALSRSPMEIANG
ncbi:hypothetical protein NRB_26600 [Novosphingobium sp. 11B]